jgi:hypothetical protein
MNENVKKISFYIFLFLVFIFIIYIIFLRPNANTNIKPTPKFDPCDRCPDKSCDPITGKCITLCRGKEKPSDNFICKEDELPGCEKSYLPTNIDSCSLNDLKCDKGFFYCQNSKECNGGDLYFTENGNKCICPDGLFGPNCEYNDSQCQNEGKMEEDGKCKCNNTSFGDKCENVCGENKIYDSTSRVCICNPLFYDIDGDKCKKKECGQGNSQNGKCECNPGFKGDKCDQKICNDNQKFDEKTKTCVCLDNKNGLQYYGKNCDVYNCNLESEFKYDEKSGPSCDCSKDLGSCGKFCEFTKSNKCNNKGTPVCVKNNKFLKCICDSEDKPKDTNPCLGIDYVCNDDGTWIDKYLNCNDLLSNYGSPYSWNQACFKKIFKSEYDNGSMTCENRDKDDKEKKDNCSKTICAKPLSCPNKPDKPCSKGKVGLCDSSTNYNWECVDQIHGGSNGNCPPLPKGSYCIKEDNTTGAPMCFQCGSGGESEWICQNEGGLPSKQCLKNLGILPLDVTGYKNSIYINKQDQSLPIFPTTDRNQCLKILRKEDNISDPYYSGQIGGYNVASLYPNPVGTIDSTTFTDLTDYNKNRYFNVKSDDLKPRCLLTDDDIVTNILKSKGSLCSGNGTFNQEVDRDYYLPSGSCNCNTGYTGNNCQYSSKDTCNNNGNPNDKGDCTCKQGYAGKNCQFSRNNCSQNGNPVSNDGTSLTSCNCDSGHFGKTCQFSNNDCNLSYLPSIQGEASTDPNDKLLCNYDKYCKIKSNTNNCILRIATLLKGIENCTTLFWTTTCSPGSYMDFVSYSFNNCFEMKGHRFNIKDFDKFKYVIFRCDGLGENYKIRRVHISKDDTPELTVLEFPDEPEGRYGESYVSVEQLNSYGSSGLYAHIEWRDGGETKSKCKLDIYLSYTNTIGR